MGEQMPPLVLHLEAELEAGLAIASILAELPPASAFRVLAHSVGAYREAFDACPERPADPLEDVEAAPPAPAPVADLRGSAAPEKPEASALPRVAFRPNEEPSTSELRAHVLELAVAGKRPIEISEETDVSGPYIGVLLSELVSLGRLERVQRGVYRAPQKRERA